ncbi:MAG TPA: hypothetical protein ENI02_02500 [Candidatus Aminicenantes bacterium]|nr:hypothetical protein [Candidatus Aminicenantes bacterium]
MGSLVGFGIEEAEGIAKDHPQAKKAGNVTQAKKEGNVSGSVIRFEDATVLAELAARRVAQSYSKHIKESYLSPSLAEKAGEKAAVIMYDMMKKGEIKALANSSLEEKIAVLVAKVQASGRGDAQNSLILLVLYQP